MTEEKKAELESTKDKVEATNKDIEPEGMFLTGDAAEQFMKSVVEEHKKTVANDPNYYAKFGYKWNQGTKYPWQNDMQEISGFGGEYEECCRFMVTKGLEFVDDMKARVPSTEDPKISTLRNVYGIVNDENETAKHLDHYLCKKTEDYFGKQFGPSGAQMQAVMTTIVWILKHSWIDYVAEMKKRKENDPDEE